jgi:hypothetical protein
MATQSKVTIVDLISLYLKHSRVEWAMTKYHAKEVHIIQGTKYELVEYNKTQINWPKTASVFWYHGVPIDLKISWNVSDLSSVAVVQTNEELRRFIGENPKVLWKDLTNEQQLTLLDCCQLIKEWQDCPTIPAVIAWYLAQYANYYQQEDFYQEVQNSPGGLERHWDCIQLADARIVLNDCDRIRAYGAEQ